MSRTKRRTSGEDRNWKNIDSREEFEEKQAEYLSQSWQGTYVASWNGQLYKRKWYWGDVAEYRDYDQYVAANLARYHSDRSWFGGGVPGWFVNLRHNRPLRARHKLQLHRAHELDSWDELVLKPFIRDAARSYW